MCFLGLVVLIWDLVLRFWTGESELEEDFDFDLGLDLGMGFLADFYLDSDF